MADNDTSNDTPMMRQYKEIKAQNQDSVLFFRMGDFYEMFYEDAVDVSRLLNLTLTKRQGVPMAGIPYHAAQNYLGRLLQAGRRVAICEQTELPQKAGRGISKREVVEIVSPGTVLQENFLEHSSNNYLQAFGKIPSATGRSGAFGTLGMALLDFSTGEFRCASFTVPNLESLGEILQRELLLASSRELLLMEELHDEFSAEFWQQGSGDTARLCNRIPAWCFAPDGAERKLCDFFAVQNLKGFGFDNQIDLAPDYKNQTWGAAWGAAWVLLEYLQQNQQQSSVLAHVQALLPLHRKEQLQLDSAALRNLEVFQNMQSGKRDYTLFQVLEQCQSAMGSRCLHRWLREPLRQAKQLEQRYVYVDSLLTDGSLRSSLRQNLAQLSDLERIMSRVSTAKANARDLVALRSSLSLFLELYTQIASSDSAMSLLSLFRELEEFAKGTESLDSASVVPTNSIFLQQENLICKRVSALFQLLLDSLTDNPPVVLHEGGMIVSGYSAELDELRQMLGDRRQILDNYVAKEQVAVGSIKLKLKYNKIIGHYFEISKAQVANAQLPQHFIRRQSLVNGERYSTEELAELETRLNSADEQIVQLERRLFEELRLQIVPHIGFVLRLALCLAELDVVANFAEIAVRNNYVRPELLEPGQRLLIEGGRHPVVEQYLLDDSFVPNDLLLDDSRFFALITGPNMAGKSTFLRQNALIVLMAQVGCYVPAKRAQIPIMDRIFCRVGASDNLSRGESTFMVEMQETARILNEATRQSLVIMDEVGRGTSTRDGLAIAQSICEFLLHETQCMTLFATHYHELTALEEPHLKLLCLAVDENGQSIRFLKHVQEGTIASSYGVHVAALAGIPKIVTARAEEILQNLLSTTEPPPKPQNQAPRAAKIAITQEKTIYQLQNQNPDSPKTPDRNGNSLLSEASPLPQKPFDLIPETTELNNPENTSTKQRLQKTRKPKLLFSEPDLSQSP